MSENLVQWVTLLSPIISVIAIIVALKVAHDSSKDAMEQVKAIRNLLDVFVAANNLDIVEAQRKYQQQLVDLDKQIEQARMDYETIYPFRSAVRIEQEIVKQEKAKQKEYLEHLFVKRKEIETNLLLIQDYINKATL